MWFYDFVTREEFEKVKDTVQEIMLKLGATVSEVDLPYENIVTSCSGGNIETYCSERPVFFFKELYYRVDEVLYPKKPFIVIELGDLHDLMNNTMEDADPFPYDLPYEELENEVKYSLGIEPYPKA